MQLSFNIGVSALGLALIKKKGYDSVARTARVDMTIQELHEHLRSIVSSRDVVIKEENVAREF